MLTAPTTAILDLNTQSDLFDPKGVWPVLNLPQVLDPIKKLFHWAARQRTPIISTRLHGVFVPSHKGNRTVCLPETDGYKKLSFTQLRHREYMPLDCGTSLPPDGFEHTQQFIFDLPGLNPFESPRLDRLLSESPASLWLLIGAPLEFSVRMAVLGLLQRRHKVAVVRDCIGQWDAFEGDMALRQIESKNIEWYTAAEAIEKFTPKKPVRTLPPPRPKAAPVPTPARKVAAVPALRGRETAAKRSFRR